MPDCCTTCRGTGRLRTTTWEGKSISEPCDACNGSGDPVSVHRLIVSDCKTGRWLRCATEGQGRQAARLRGWKDYTIEPDGGRHG